VDIVLGQLFPSMQRFLRPATPKRNNILGLEELSLIKINRNNLSDFKHNVSYTESGGFFWGREFHSFLMKCIRTFLLLYRVIL